jgi:hypothetical protein
MKRIFTFLGLTLVTSVFSQVTVTYKVDITNYLAGGATLSANGIRVGGNFADQSATVGASSIPNWTPNDANSAMTDLGNNIWSIAITYPTASVGATQNYKFVNGDWGTNEGTDPANTIASGGCGIDDGGGNINRTLTIPASDTTVLYCWDQCAAACETGSIGEINKFEVKTYPNPANEVIQFDIAADDYVISISDISGKLIMTSEKPIIDIAPLNSGIYTYVVNSTTGSAKGKFIKK